MWYLRRISTKWLLPNLVQRKSSIPLLPHQLQQVSLFFKLKNCKWQLFNRNTYFSCNEPLIILMYTNCSNLKMGGWLVETNPQQTSQNKTKNLTRQDLRHVAIVLYSHSAWTHKFLLSRDEKRFCVGYDTDLTIKQTHPYRMYLWYCWPK